MSFNGVLGRDTSSPGKLSPGAAPAPVGPQVFTVSATTSLTVTAVTAGYVPTFYFVSGASSLTVSTASTEVNHSPTIYNVSASNSFVITASSSETLSRIRLVSASTSLSFSSSCKTAHDFHVTATTTFYPYGTAHAYDTRLFVSASTGLVISQVLPRPYVFGPRFVSASTTFILSTPASLIANILIHVSAMTGLSLSGTALGTRSGSVLVSANSSVSFTQRATYISPGPRYAAASTNLGLATTATSIRSAILTVSASSSLTLSTSGSEVASLNVAAACGVVLSGAGRQNRGIAASATTSLGLSNAPKTSNLKTANAASTMTLIVSALSLITGTEADSRLVLADLAQAVVWIPWRRAALTLPAGGNLPHS